MRRSQRLSSVAVFALAAACPLKMSLYGAPCTSDADCGSAWVCADVDQGGAQCVPSALLGHRDAGTSLDAGPSDAGAQDGGHAVADAGSLQDGGDARDAGARADGGRALDGGAGVDAGHRVDAGAPDAGAIDGGQTRDAGGSPDGGAVDAGTSTDAGSPAGRWLRVVLERPAVPAQLQASLHVMRDTLAEYCTGQSDCHQIPCQSGFRETDWDGDGEGGGPTDPVHTSPQTPDGGPVQQQVEALNVPPGRYFIVVDRWANNFLETPVTVQVYRQDELLRSIQRELSSTRQTWVVAELVIPSDASPWAVTLVDQCQLDISCVANLAPDGGLSPTACE